VTQEKILFLGPENSSILIWLREQGEEVFQTQGKITAQSIDLEAYGFLISYGYRHILGKQILDKFIDRAINLHISYLPWNRGADPNFWSFIGKTPKGVTIHYLDEGVDTGDIILQNEIVFDVNKETLASSYEQLQAAIQELFIQNWNEIKNGLCLRHRQYGEGSHHRVRDKEPLAYLLTSGWNTPVSVLANYAAETQMSR
jgi:methionyl-tRNA formyltransferase